MAGPCRRQPQSSALWSVYVLAMPSAPTKMLATAPTRLTTRMPRRPLVGIGRIAYQECSEDEEADGYREANTTLVPFCDRWGKQAGEQLQRASHDEDPARRRCPEKDESDRNAADAKAEEPRPQLRRHSVIRQGGCHDIALSTAAIPPLRREALCRRVGGQGSQLSRRCHDEPRSRRCRTATQQQK